MSLPEPTGPHTVGFLNQDLEDPFRKRLIPIRIYFPMEKGAHTLHPKIFEERALIAPFEPLKVKVYSKSSDPSHIAGEQHPLVFINHGSSVSMTDYAFLAEDLSSHGYVVVSIQHDLKTDGASPPFWEGKSYSRNAKTIDNLLYVFEWLQTTPLKIDVKRVALVGHSLGANSLLLFNAFQKEKDPALLPRPDQIGVKECMILMEPTRFFFPITQRYPLFFLLAENRELGGKVKSYKGSTHISFMDHGYIHGEPYFYGSLEERKAFYNQVRQDVRDFLVGCDVK